jgi:hypothetical protein
MARGVLAVLAVAGVLAGCGDDEPTSASSPTPAPTAAATETPTPTPTLTETATPTATEQPAPEEQEGGAGDEEEARVPVVFTVSDDGVLPVRVGVPAFLALELIVKNQTSEPVVARLEGEEPLTAGPRDTARLRIEGRRKGRYTVDFGAGRTVIVITGVEPGP